MTLSRQDRIEAIFDSATGIDVPERASFLDQACGGDLALRREIERLLMADAVTGQVDGWQRSALNQEVCAERTTPDRRIGEVLGRYRLTAIVGGGGMGRVYRAVRADAQFEKSVAVKLIHSPLASDDLQARFKAERQILATLEHPNIARLLDGGLTDDGLPYLVMEFVEGVLPADYCCQHGLGMRAKLALFQQICAAVHYAHQHMVIHRDLKPANILVTAGGEPKLLDFGIAKVLTPQTTYDPAITRMDNRLLTPRYASPEQIRGEAITTGSDVFALGVLGHELLTGASPYRYLTGHPLALLNEIC